MVTPNLGGRGAVRSVCDLLVAARQHASRQFTGSKSTKPKVDDQGQEESPRMMGRVLIGLAIIALVVGVLIFGQGTGSSLARKSTETSGDLPWLLRP